MVGERARIPFSQGFQRLEGGGRWEIRNCWESQSLISLYLQVIFSHMTNEPRSKKCGIRKGPPLRSPKSL